MSNIESTKGEIVMYQPDETIRLEVRMESETVWLSQAQMAELFGTGRQAITKHLQNIYECEELEKDATSSILELVRKEGKRNVITPTSLPPYTLVNSHKICDSCNLTSSVITSSIHPSQSITASETTTASSLSMM